MTGCVSNFLAKSRLRQRWKWVQGASDLSRVYFASRRGSLTRKHHKNSRRHIRPATSPLRSSETRHSLISFVYVAPSLAPSSSHRAVRSDKDLLERPLFFFVGDVEDGTASSAPLRVFKKGRKEANMSTWAWSSSASSIGTHPANGNGATAKLVSSSRSVRPGDRPSSMSIKVCAVELRLRKVCLPFRKPQPRFEESVSVRSKCRNGLL